ncbi:chorismate synthase [Parasphaerochaeta coccoides]|uniref:Chorismate synthase n=1 Tax=Parasphaerochaeta coccoides (strain ATCC BAA-1237 / DSM 17374 / SPN1) TaxID=760011 RepID=F4GKZ7_PARC1|nr:chorismate synthase [Parasphaerochaeta coccoides]AEC01910.1 chorismate synthase [Parasphaerochaeta coccoides DSM 17374]
MSGNVFGEALNITTFGESHGAAIGVTIDGLEAGFPLDLDMLQKEMNRRRPGGNPLATPRKESDTIQILSGMFDGLTTGAPLTIVLFNTNQNSADYTNIAEVFRPGHADWTWYKKFTVRDWRGSGRASGRETAARVAAGAVAKQVLAVHGIQVTAGITRIGTITALSDSPWEERHLNILSCPDQVAATKMAELIENLRAHGDSVGGIIECHIDGLWPGIGEPVFDKLTALLAHAMLSIGAVKGIEFGDGFAAAGMYGSQFNDSMVMGSDEPKFITNHAGGTLGGISTGEQVIFRIAMKPTSSISLPQKTVNKKGEEEIIEVHGRHDPCICLRAVPVVEAMAALVILDLIYRQNRRSGHAEQLGI